MWTQKLSIQLISHNVDLRFETNGCVDEDKDSKTFLKDNSTKAPVEAETSTIINERLFFFIEFHFEL